LSMLKPTAKWLLCFLRFLSVSVELLGNSLKR
jgi:hypothetical protein